MFFSAMIPALVVSSDWFVHRADGQGKWKQPFTPTIIIAEAAARFVQICERAGVLEHSYMIDALTTAYIF